MTTIIWLVIAGIGVAPIGSGAALTLAHAAAVSHHALPDDATAHAPCAGEATDPVPCGDDLACAQFCTVLPVAPFDADRPAASAPPVNAAPADSSILVRPPHLPPKA